MKNNYHSVIRLSNLSKRFADVTAVDGLSLDIFKGEVFGFLGPNGAGKTTTINMICGIYPPSEGEILFWDDKGIKKQDIKTLIGICPQENIFWPKLSCEEQLNFVGNMYGMSAKSVKSRSKELLHMLGLEEKSKALASKLSGGMKRRLNLCLALIHDPEILVLDEPEAGLDPQSRILVRNFIKSMAQEKTIILTTHNMDEADRMADRVAIIDHGKLLLVETPEKMKKSIGEGDILEIVLDITDKDDISTITNALRKICDQVKSSADKIIIKSKNLIESVSEITNRIKEHGYIIKEITLRENTLEDVFIYLTGRKLRQ